MSRRLRSRKRGKLNNLKINKKVLLISGIILCIILFFSIIFSIINIGNSKIISGVKVGEIDISNLTSEEATEKIKNWYNEVVTKNVTIKYEEIEENVTIEEFNSSIDIDKIIKEACLVGKSGNIFTNNYEILFTMLFSKNIDTNIKIDEKQINKKIQELNSKLPNAMEESNYYIEEDNLIINKGKKGIKIKDEEFKKILNETILKEEYREFIIPTEEILPEEINIDKIYQEIYKKEQNASITQNPIKVNPHVNGVDFAISIEEVKNILNEEKEEYIIPLKITIPEITLNELAKEAFPQMLGTFSTTYKMDNQNRVTNLELASEKVNGTIILPGETFSYNKIVGERTIAKGYKEAAVYSGGKIVDGIGGGICQLSSTLYNAVVYANLEVTQRSNHRFLTSYVTAGRDATVSWGTIDFCFKNTRSYPIKVVSSVKNGVVTTQIYGIPEEKEYEIEIQNIVTEVIPYTTKYIKDNSLEKDVEEIKQYGANGAKSETYKIIKDNGVIISRELISSDVYSPLENIIARGAKSQTIQINANESEVNPELLKLIKQLE